VWILDVRKECWRKSGNKFEQSCEQGDCHHWERVRWLGEGKGGGNLTPKNAKHPPLNINIVSSASGVKEGGRYECIVRSSHWVKISKLRRRTSRIYNSRKNWFYEISIFPYNTYLSSNLTYLFSTVQDIYRRRERFFSSSGTCLMTQRVLEYTKNRSLSFCIAHFHFQKRFWGTKRRIYPPPVLERNDRYKKVVGEVVIKLLNISQLYRKPCQISVVLPFLW
jgi:hypothetical protein